MKPITIIFILVLWGILFSACRKEKTTVDEIPTSDTYLKELAATKKITIGTLYNYSYSHSGYNDYQTYNRIISNEFDLYALEWEFAPDEIWKGENKFDYQYLDKALSFAQSKGLKVRGTHLFWYAQTPQWLENGNYTSDKVKSLVKNYITQLFTHIQTSYPDVLTEVSVANEVLHDKETAGTYGDLRDCFWVRKLGVHYIDSAFVWVKNAYPNAKLILNEYGNEFADDYKTQSFLELVNRLKTNNIPVDAIGLQCHFTIDTEDNYDRPFHQQEFENALADYNELGIEVIITELDVRINDDQTGASEKKYQQQADLYQQIFESCLKFSKIKNITMWGFNDELSYLNDCSWLPQDKDWGLIFDKDFNPKPAYFSITEVLKK